MLCVLLVLIAIRNVCCDITLSTSEISMEVGEIKSLQIYISNISLDNITNALWLTTQHLGTIEVISCSLNENTDYNHSVTFSYEVKLRGRKAGKSNVYATIGSLITNVQGNYSISLPVKVYRNKTIELISIILGWCYFTAWSLSFYPQLYTNYKNKSVIGLSFDFVLFNVYGYLMYTVFNVGMYFVPIVKGQYARRHPSSPLPVQTNDLVFTAHSVFVTVFAVIQCALYKSDKQTISTKAKVIMVHYLAATASFIGLALSNVILWLDVLYLFSYTKLFVTVTKYTPQVYLNYKRKTTKGWSIGSVVLDFTGGILCIHQMVLNGYNYGDWTVIVENPTKFGLGVLSLIFAVIFLTQHFIFCVLKSTQTDVKTELNDVVVQLIKVTKLKDTPTETENVDTNTGATLKLENVEKIESNTTAEHITKEVDTGISKSPRQPKKAAVQKTLNDGITLKVTKITKREKKPRGYGNQEEVHDGIIVEVTSVVNSEKKRRPGGPKPKFLDKICEM